jgi:hypothetical protein
VEKGFRPALRGDESTSGHLRSSRTRFADRVRESGCPLERSDHDGQRDEPDVVDAHASAAGTHRHLLSGVADRSAVCELIARDDPPRNGRVMAGQTVVIRKTRRCGLIFPASACASVPERQGRCQPPLLHVKQSDRAHESENERSPCCASLLNGHVGRGDHRPVGDLRSSLRCGLSLPEHFMPLENGLQDRGTIDLAVRSPSRVMRESGFRGDSYSDGLESSTVALRSPSLPAVIVRGASECFHHPSNFA